MEALQNGGNQAPTKSEKDWPSDTMTSQQEAIKQIDELKKQVSHLKSELRQVRVDRDHHVELVQSMNVKFKEFEEFSVQFRRALANVRMKVVAKEASHQEVIKERDELEKEVDELKEEVSLLRSELQQVRVDRDHQEESL